MRTRALSLMMGFVITFVSVCGNASLICNAQTSVASLSAVESASDAVSMLGNDVLFMTSNGKFFANGIKQDYSNVGSDSFLLNNEVMVDFCVLEYSFNISIQSDGTKALVNGKSIEMILKDGAYFLPASEFGKALLMYVYNEDNRGFVLLSTENREYTNSSYSHDNQEDIDVIWRYMQFDRPDGDEILNALKSSDMYRTHPRLLIKNSEIQTVADRINNDKSLKAKKALLLAQCNKYLDKDPVVPTLDGIRLFASCYEVKDRLINLCTAYLLADSESQKEQYAERAWIELDSACNWDNWNLGAHFLDSGEIGPGIAFAYDVLYDYLDDTQKKSVRDRVNSLYLEYCEGIYTVPRTSNYEPMAYKNVQSNWGAVCSASMLMVALTFMDEEDTESELTQRCQFIASNALQSLEHIATAFSPEGNWGEGLGYWEYVMQHMAWSVLGLKNVLGSDYNFMSVPGFYELPDYGMYNQTEIGSFNKASTTMAINAFAPEVFVYAGLCNNPDKMKLYNEFYDLTDKNAFLAQYLLFYNPLLSSETGEYEIPLDKYYSSNGNSIMKGSWNSADSVYVGISGGKTTTYNDTHYDKGSFVFEALGERWSIDMGRNGNDTMPFLKRAETHSTLVVNPSSDGMGQSFDADTYAEVFETKPRGAVAIYNLTNAYSDYANNYKRGFMLGDDRNTLTIRDEINLLQESDLVWNMITKADIEISKDKKSAYLTQNGKKILVTAACSADNWSFEEKADLAPTGGWVEGDGGFSVSEQQEFSVNAKKLVLSCNTSGNSYIEVKLIPVIEGESYSSASSEPMSSWTVPDGELVGIIISETVKNGDVVNSSNPLLIPVTVTGEFESITLYAEGEEVYTVNECSSDSKYDLVLPADKITLAGELPLDIVVKYPGYRISKNITLNVCKEYKLNELATVDFSKYPDGDVTSEDVRKALGLKYVELKDGYGAISKAEYLDSPCLKFSLIKSNDVSGSLAYIQLNKTVDDGNVIHLSFDAVASASNLKLNMSFSKVYTIFNTNGKFFKNGTKSYIPGELYHIDFVADTLNKQYRICVFDSDGALVAQEYDLFSNDSYNGGFRLSFGTVSGDNGYFLIDNMKIGKSNYLQINDQSYFGDDVFNFSRSTYSKGLGDFTDSLKYIAFYDEDNTLLDFEEYGIDEDNFSGDAYNIPTGTSYLKVFFWSNELKPYLISEKLYLK